MSRNDTDENSPMKKKSVEIDFGKVLNALMGFIIIGFSIFARGIRCFCREKDTGAARIRIYCLVEPCYNLLMKRKGLKNFMNSIIFAAAIALIWPGCCCFGNCADMAMAAPAVENDDIHGCCQKPHQERLDLVKTCDCFSIPRDFQFAFKHIKIWPQEFLYRSLAVDALSNRMIASLYAIQELAALTYTGPPIFILNCVYRC